MKIKATEFIIIIIMIVSVLTIELQRIYYIRKNNKKITFVVRLKNGITHYIDLPENTTRDELIECVVRIRISDEEETNIMGIYNIYGEELEYVKGVWVVK